MHRLLLVVAMMAVGLAACGSDPRALKFTRDNVVEVMAEVEKSDRVAEADKAVLREYVGSLTLITATAGALAGLLGDGKTLSTGYPFDGKTVGEVLAVARIVAKARAQEEAESKRKAEAQRTAVGAYIHNLEIRKVTARRWASPREPGPTAFIEGEIRNAGERTLTRVAVTCYLLDESGRPVKEDTSYPVLGGGSGAFTATPPMKPAYVADILCVVKNAPDEWRGAVDVKVTDIQFE